MHSVLNQPVLQGKEGQGRITVIKWSEEWSVEALAAEIKDSNIKTLVFEDAGFFNNFENTMTMCREIISAGLNILWSATLQTKIADELLREMRQAGCQRLDMYLDSDDAIEMLTSARLFGFDICIRNSDGTSYVTDRVEYTVEERKTVAELFPALHAAQFELAAAYFEAGRIREVMHPLAKAMTLGYPMNEHCLNLLACLSAARHYPDLASGLLVQAHHNGHTPVVEENKKQMNEWYASRGDMRGTPLQLEVETRPFA